MEFWEVEQQFAYWRKYPPVTDFLLGVFQKTKPQQTPEMTVEDFMKIPLPKGSLSFDELDKIAKRQIVADLAKAKK